MAVSADEAQHIEKLYVLGERLSVCKDKSQNVKDFEEIINVAKSSTKAKQLAAQMIPRFFKFFPDLSERAFECYEDFGYDEDFGVRVQAIRGLPIFCKDKHEYVPRTVDYLVQLLAAGDIVERDAAHTALMSVLRQNVKASLTALFDRISNVEELSRENILSFIRDKVFPLRSELLKPQEEMERHIADLIKKSLEDVTASEFKMFMNFLKTLSIFGEKAPPERMKELVGLIEAQADLNAQFSVSNEDHIDRLISCLFLAVPFFTRGASSSKFLNYLSKDVLPVFDQFSEEGKLGLLKALSETSPYTTSQDSRQILSSVVQLLKKYMPGGEEMNFTYVECLLYTFHHLAQKVPNATNSLCGYKIVTGQPSDRLGEDFSKNYKEFIERLNVVEELTRATMKKLTQGMAEHNKSLAAAETYDDKNKIKILKQNTTSGLRTCNNILAMTKPLHAKTPSFIGDKSITLSWKEASKPSVPAAATATGGGKRPASAVNGFGNAAASKRGRGAGGVQNHLVNRGLGGLSQGGRGVIRGRGRSWSRGGRGRGRGYW